MDSKLAYMRLLNNRQQNTHPQAKLWISINPLWKVQEQVSSGPPAGLHSEELGMPSDKLSDQLPCRLFELQVSKSFPVARSQYVTFCTLKLTFLLVAGDMLYQQSWRKQTKKNPKNPTKLPKKPSEFRPCCTRKTRSTHLFSYSNIWASFCEPEPSFTQKPFQYSTWPRILSTASKPIKCFKKSTLSTHIIPFHKRTAVIFIYLSSEWKLSISYFKKLLSGLLLSFTAHSGDLLNLGCSRKISEKRSYVL